MMQGKTYLDLVDAFRTTRGFEIYTLKHTIEVSYNIFRGNFAELDQILQKHSRLDPRYHGAANREHLQEEFKEIARLLHNYCASVMSLVDHTRRVAKKVLSGKSLKAYQSEIEVRYKCSDLHQFLQDLRNFFTHHSIPPISFVVRNDPKLGPRTGIELPTKLLVEYPGWKKESRDFILHHKDGIFLDEIIHEYGSNVEDFLHWLDNHIECTCKPELDEMWERHDKWAAFCKSQGIPTTQAQIRESIENRTL